MTSLISKISKWLQNVARSLISANTRVQSNDDCEVVMCDDGALLWYKDLSVHRLIGPAAIHANGYVVWVQYDNVHRTHRTNGPAIIHPDGVLEYKVNNQLHRTNGPALVSVNGYVEYWIEGRNISEVEFFLQYRAL